MMPGASVNTPPALLSADGLSVWFHGASGRIDAVRNVSLEVKAGEVLAIIGESGSGKSTLARALLGMITPGQGTLLMDGSPVPRAASMRTLAQRRRISMVFQDSSAAFNPRFTVEQILLEPLRLMSTRQEISGKHRPAALLEQVSLSSSLLSRRPHELSGGQRQRVGIARALASEPELLICDEAVSALDVSVQAQILNLLSNLQADRKLAFLFITHDLGVVEYFADRVAVMYRGRIIETGPLADILDHPQTEYTRRLLEARPALSAALG
jgi:peptide/nickel transport system ATP-binding protein